jgi:hypothetical protein
VIDPWDLALQVVVVEMMVAVVGPWDLALQVVVEVVV